jgi:hypothetical protein
MAMDFREFGEVLAAKYPHVAKNRSVTRRETDTYFAQSLLWAMRQETEAAYHEKRFDDIRGHFEFFNEHFDACDPWVQNEILVNYFEDLAPRKGRAGRIAEKKHFRAMKKLMPDRLHGFLPVSPMWNTRGAATPEESADDESV